MVREPVVAGQFYEGNEILLRKQIESCFLSPFGPGELPVKISPINTKAKNTKAIKTPQTIMKAMIVPHAGYMFSGMCAAWGYKMLAESKKPDLFIIIGPNHTGIGKTSIMLEDFRTPLGIAKIDKEFGKELIKSKDIQDDPRSHKYEHSIEVQLPFLQFCLKDFLFLPIVVSSPHYINCLVEGIKNTAAKLKKEICILASSDFTHYGYNYGYVPFTKNVKENLSQLDNKAIELIKNNDVEGLTSYINQTGATICGFLPIIALMKIIGKSKTTLLKYYTSGDVIADYSNSVSYVSLVFE